MFGGMSNVWSPKTLNEQQLSEGGVERLSPKAMPQQNELPRSILSQLIKERMQHDLHPLEDSIKHKEFSDVETQQTQQSPGRFSVTLSYESEGRTYSIPVRVGKHNMSMLVATSIYGPAGGGRWRVIY
jgi:hypothetical protein